jgi:putative ABC transport system permease protein
MDADPARAWPEWDAGDAVLVSEPYAYYHGVGRGDAIELPTDQGTRRFAVAGTYRSYDANASSVLMNRATYDRWFEDQGIDAIGLYLEEDADPGAVRDRLAALGSADGTLEIESNAGLREMSLEVFDQTFVITDVLYWLALGVAFAGVFSAMLALQLERGRETATLRALGMTPGQVGGMLTAQTGLLGLLSGLAAIPLGIVMAWVLIVVINRRAFGWQIDMTVAPGIVAASVALAVAAALLAGLYPAWRAARNSPALAMREE